MSISGSVNLRKNCRFLSRFLYMVYQVRKNRTEPEDIVYALHLYFNGLSLRNTKAISKFVTRSHTAIRDRIQKYNPKRLFYRKTKIFEFILDETQIKVGSELIN